MLPAVKYQKRHLTTKVILERSILSYYERAKEKIRRKPKSKHLVYKCLLLKFYNLSLSSKVNFYLNSGS